VDFVDRGWLSSGAWLVGPGSGLAADELAGYVDVVALLERFGSDGAFAKECEWDELPVFNGSALSLVKPALGETRSNELTAAGIRHCGLIGQIACKDDLVKNLH
jgi:hypothetical protein